VIVSVAIAVLLSTAVGGVVSLAILLWRERGKTADALVTAAEAQSQAEKQAGRANAYKAVAAIQHQALGDAQEMINELGKHVPAGTKFDVVFGAKGRKANGGGEAN
jgi:hypothetical protein